MRAAILVALGYFLFSAETKGATPQPNPPTRLTVQAAKRTAAVNERVRVTVELRDAYGQMVPARKTYDVNLELWLSGRIVWRQSLPIPANSAAGAADVNLPGPGLVLVKATHPELREDSAYVRTRAGHTQGSWLRGWARGARTSCKSRRRPVAVDPPAPPPKMDLTLVYSDMGANLTANGSDYAKITAFLDGRAPRELKLRFTADGAQVSPDELIIPAGADSAEARVTTNRVGVATVTYLGSNAGDLLNEPANKEKKIQFDVAIKEVRLVASPPRVPLGDSTNLIAEFIGLDGSPIQVPDTRKVSIVLSSGLGDIVPNPVEISQGSGHRGIAKFTPRQRGLTQISASGFGASSRSPTDVSVYLPLSMGLIVFFLGGLSSAARILIKPVGARAALIGAAVGGMSAVGLCALAAFGLSKQLPPNVALHPIGMSAAALLIGLGAMKVTV